jgi:hypothetical protein
MLARYSKLGGGKRVELGALHAPFGFVLQEAQIGTNWQYTQGTFGSGHDDLLSICAQCPQGRLKEDSSRQIDGCPR